MSNRPFAVTALVHEEGGLAAGPSMTRLSLPVMRFLAAAPGCAAVRCPAIGADHRQVPGARLDAGHGGIMGVRQPGAGRTRPESGDFVEGGGGLQTREAADVDDARDAGVVSACLQGAVEPFQSLRPGWPMAPTYGRPAAPGRRRSTGLDGGMEFSRTGFKRLWARRRRCRPPIAS